MSDITSNTVFRQMVLNNCEFLFPGKSPLLVTTKDSNTGKSRMLVIDRDDTILINHGEIDSPCGNSDVVVRRAMCQLLEGTEELVGTKLAKLQSASKTTMAVREKEDGMKGGLIDFVEKQSYGIRMLIKKEETQE